MVLIQSIEWGEEEVLVIIDLAGKIPGRTVRVGLAQILAAKRYLLVKPAPTHV